METQELLQRAMIDILKSHGLSPTLHNQWVLVDGNLPGISAEIVEVIENPKALSIQLDVRVCISSEKVIVESFAGIGSDIPRAVMNALENFCLNSLHVFLVSFWKQATKDMVTVEQWEIKGQKWKAVIGNFGIRNLGADPITIPDELFPTIKKLIRNTLPSDDLCWMRFFYCNVNRDKVVSQVLFNNLPWELAQDEMLALDWLKSDSYYSIRNFLILQREKNLLDKTLQRFSLKRF